MSTPAPALEPTKRIYPIPDYRDSVFEGWAIRYLETNFWKFQKTIGDWEDAVSEAALCYYETRKRYAASVYSPQHFMALFKLCLHSWFVDWANWDTKVTTTEATYAKATSEVTTGFEGNLNILFREMSAELRDVLKVIVGCPAEVLATFRQDVKRGVDVFFRNAATHCGVAPEKVKGLEGELFEALSFKRVEVKARAGNKLNSSHRLVASVQKAMATGK